MPARLHVVQSVGGAFPAPQVETTDRELPELLMPLGAQDEHSARILHITLIALCMVVLGAILWAAFAQVSDVASATGTLEPNAHERRIEHIDGGQVARLMVREGDKVSAGQPLMELDGAQAAGDVASARQRLTMIEAQLGTVKSLQAHGDTGAGAAVRAALMHAEQAAARARQQAASLAMIHAQLATAERAATIAREDRDRARRLFAAEAVTRSTLNQREQILNDAEGRVASLRNQLGVAGGGLTQADSEAASVRSRQAVDLYQESNTLELQTIEANVLLKRALARADRLTVRSPVDGVVKVVPVSPGSVVPPGGLLAVVVPTDGKLVVEAQIPSSEMRDLRTGLAAHVRIAGFDLPGKGWIDGTVRSVSSSSFANDQGQRFYKVRIVLDDTSLSPAIARDLSPGLEAHADIVTGHKSVLAFLVSPVRHGLDSALTEK